MDSHNFRKPVKKYKDFQETDEEPVEKKRSYMEEEKNKLVSEWRGTGSMNDEPYCKDKRGT